MLLEENRPTIVSNDWVSVLQYWISTECQFSVTKNLQREDLISGGAKEKNLTIISLAALGNLGIKDLTVAEHVVRSFLIREILQTLKSYPNMIMRDQTARLVSILSNHGDTFVNKRLLALVGVEGFLTLYQNSSESTKFFICSSIASLGLEREFAKEFVIASKAGWNLIEQLLAESKGELEVELARAIANFSTSSY